MNLDYSPLGLKAALMALFLIFAGPSFAQDKLIKGRITHAQTGEPLSGVSIKREGTVSGTLTNRYGQYSMYADEGQELRISADGYKTITLRVGPNNQYNIKLQPVENPLEEIIETGYGETKTIEINALVQKLGNQDFARGSITTPQELLLGKVAGLQVTTLGGAPGENSAMVLRGRSSLVGNNNPLVLIDGTPLDNDGPTGTRNPLGTINPADIESITILKDAAATAIYGSRATNGVILIHTKIARPEQPLRVNYSGYASVGEVANKIDVLSADEFRGLINQRYGNNPIATGLLGNSATNWQDEVYKTAISTDHSLSLSGNQGGVPFRVAYGYTGQKGVLDTDKFTRITMSVGIQPTMLDNHLKAKFNFKAMLNNNRYADRDIIQTAATFDPTQPIRNDSPYGGYFTWVNPDGLPVAGAPLNPVGHLIMNEDFTRIVSSLGNLQLDYRFHNMPELRAILNLAYDASHGAGEITRPEHYPTLIDRENGGGMLRKYDQTKNNKLIDFYLNYSKDYLRFSGKMDATAGYSGQSFKRVGKDFETNLQKTVDRYDYKFDTKYGLRSFFARLNYSFFDKYLISTSLRTDGVSYYTKPNNFGTFAALGLAWQINEEGFLKNVESIDNLKLRISYGLTGQHNFTYIDQPVLPGVVPVNELSEQTFNDRWHWASRTVNMDENLEWEKTTTYNFGLDYGFAGNRIWGAIDAYHRLTEDLAGFIYVPTSENPNNIVLSNVGKLENKGAEFSLNIVPVKSRSIIWDIGFNFAYNKNIVTRLKLPSTMPHYGIYTGTITGGTGNSIQIHSIDYPANSFFVYEQIYENGKPVEGLYVDRVQDQVYTHADRYHAYKPDPDIIMGLSTSLKWGNLDFYASGRSHQGNYVYNNVWSHGAVYSNLFNQVYPGSPVNPDGYLENLNRNILETQFGNPRYFSDYYLSDASFIKIDNVTLGYTFYGLFGKETRVRLYSAMQNVYTITNYKGLDPEVYNGIDNYRYPRPRNMIFGINVDF